MKQLFCLVLFSIICCQTTFAQNVNELVSHSTFHDYEYHEVQKRQIMQVKQKWNPVNLLSLGLMHFYQRVISHQLQASCSYEISCSQYTKLSIEEQGLIKGGLLGFYQLQSCFSHNHLDYPDYKITKNGTIVNQIGLEK